MSAIKDARIKKGVTQETAAIAIGISYSMYTKLENGYRGASQKTMAEVARYFNASVTDLFFADAVH
ncbi:helix-turn-helix transcriptional regulator [Lacticaseibacillus suilingensis]|uniref:helix-turn-helix transcriptional regulator n=1 Tax=Lacticaseibacillus suilingensis TaxID=2799577 RepID=UPI0022E8EB15|nr:helix-turn-helix transcriptional regulator [Lacticaseibacillus suilingensis]